MGSPGSGDRKICFYIQGLGFRVYMGLSEPSFSSNRIIILISHRIKKILNQRDHTYQNTEYLHAAGKG